MEKFIVIMLLMYIRQNIILKNKLFDVKNISGGNLPIEIRFQGPSLAEKIQNLCQFPCRNRSRHSDGYLFSTVRINLGMDAKTRNPDCDGWSPVLQIVMAGAQFCRS